LFHAPGYRIFSVPSDITKIDKRNIAINFMNLDFNWKTISSHGIKDSIVLNITFQDLLQSFYAAGKIRIYSIGNNIQPIFLSLYGNFSIEDQQIALDLKEIINSQRTFFNDFDFSNYTISLIEGNHPTSAGGTNLFNSFTAFFPQKSSRNDYYLLCAHEHLHNWLGGKIKHKNNTLDYWFTEGFTEFYSRVIALRSKGINKDTFINEVNKILQEYYLSPVNQEPNLIIEKEFSNNSDIKKLPYYRGFVFALYLNNLIQKENMQHSLDLVIYDLFKITTKQNFSSSLFKTIARKYVKGGIESDFTSFIDQGNLINLENIMLPIKKISKGKYYLGFNEEIIVKKKIIQDIDIKSNAYRAGLRNEQKIISYDCLKSSNQICIVKTSNKTFKFYPEGYNTIEIYQLKEKFLTVEEEQFNTFFGLKQQINY
jgi:predicted metalloprotease with PDZ domain